MTHPFTEDGPGELYDAEAERNAAYCDACGNYHSGPCPPFPEDFDEDMEHDIGKYCDDPDCEHCRRIDDLS